MPNKKHVFLFLTAVILPLSGGGRLGLASDGQHTLAKAPPLEIPSAKDADNIRLTPGLIAALLVETSDAANIVKNEFMTADTGVLRFDANFSGKIESKLSYFDDRNEPAQSISPTRNKVTQFNLGYSKQFVTGTSVKTEFQHQQRFPEGVNPLFLSDGYENDLSLSIRQSLLKNSFGSMNRQREASALNLRDATKHSISDRLQRVAVDGIGLYFQAWLSQWQVRAADARLKRQEQLLKLTKINARRGTAEQADVMQIEAAVILSQNGKKDAQKKLLDLWNSLVLSLKLPRDYLSIDPMRIYLDPENHLPEARVACKSTFPDGADRIKALELSLKAANLNHEATSSALRPELYLEARVSGNGIDKEMSQIWDETFTMKHPQTSIALGIDVPTSFDREKADYLEALKIKKNAEIQMSQAKTQFEINRDQYCREAQTLDYKIAGLKKALDLQVKREKAEQNRFRIGRIDAFTVIKAGNDITDAEIALKSTEAQLQMTAWSLLYESGKLSDQLAASLKAGMRK
jgi:outer membrane protein TolC